MQTEVFLKGDIENALRAVAYTMCASENTTEFQHGFGLALTAVAAALGLPNPGRYHSMCVTSIMVLWPELAERG